MSKTTPIIFFFLLPLLLFGKMVHPDVPVATSFNTFEPLRIGAVKPKGWIREQFRNDIRYGIAGHFLQLKPNYGLRTYLKKNANLGQGEMTGNWADGFVRMVYLSDDERIKSKIDHFVRRILDTRSKKGYLGNVKRKLRFQNTLTGELWTQSRLYVALLAYYELTGKKEVLNAVVRATRLTMQKYHAGNLPFQRTREQEKMARKRVIQSHGLMFVDVLEWLYRITGDKEYVSFAKLLYDDFSHTAAIDDPDVQLPHLLNMKYPFFWHGAHTVEQVRVPLFLKYADSQNMKYAEASDNAMKKLFKHIVPSGSITSAEAIRNAIPTAKRYYEYCTTTEFATTLESALAKTGKMDYADKIETDVLNAAQASRTPDGKEVSYLTADTRITATKDHDFPHTGKGRCQLSPAHKVGGSCCSANAVKVLPYYVSSMWMRSVKNGGLVAALFGPCRVNTTIKGIPVSIEEDTAYPFDNTITFKIRSKKSVEFPLTIRIPKWAGKVDMKASGAEIKKYADRYVLRKKWKQGNKVTVHFENPIRLKHLPDGTVSVYKGPLLFVQPWGYKKIELPKKFRVPGFHEYDLIGTPNYDDSISYVDLKAKNYGMKAKYMKKGDLLHPWANPPLVLDADLRAAVRQNDCRKPFKLVPIGSTLIRFASFRVWPFDDAYFKGSEPK